MIFCVLLLCLWETSAQTPAIGRHTPIDQVLRVPPDQTRPVLVVLPPSTDPLRQKFAENAFEQMALHFSRFGFKVPSLREVRHLVQTHPMPEERKLWYQPVAQWFEARYVADLQIEELLHQKKINPAGVLSAGVLLTGIGRYVQAEYKLNFYVQKQHRVIEQTAWQRERDYGLGFWQSSEIFAMKEQTRTLDALLRRLARRTLQRSRGYILEPFRKDFVDARGFR